MKSRGWFLSFLFLLTLNVFATGCDPVPGKPLTLEQKTEDMMWLFSRFNEFYAPRKYKEEKYDFNFEELKKKYLAKAKRTENNEEFYAVMQEFVANFRDAHTSLSLTPSVLPGRARIAFLGITGERFGDVFRVKEILPTINPQEYPLKKGDIITHIDGTPILEYIEKNIVPYRNLGNMDSNYTAHMASLFTRISLSLPIPTKDTVELTYKPLIKEKYEPASSKLVMPWIIRDLQDFKVELKAAKEAVGSKKEKSALWFNLDNTEVALLDQNGNALTVNDLKFLYQGPRDFDSNYRFMTIGGWTTDKAAVKLKEKSKGMDKLKLSRKVPENAIAIETAENYPAYIKGEDVLNKKGRPTGKKTLTGYIFIDSFSYDDNTASEIEVTLAKFQDLGVSEVIVDTMGNPGGSISLMMKIAQAFSNLKVKMPGQQFGLSRWWLDNIQTEALQSTGAKKEMFTRLYEDLNSQYEQGLRLSRTYNMAELIPYELKPNYKIKKNFKMTILVNEMNASCGDIFPMIMQENKLAKIIGVQTMGAGGNVASFMQAPNSRADLRQTLSLVVKADGSYLENNGVKPDLEMSPNKMANQLMALETVARVIKARTRCEARLADL